MSGSDRDTEEGADQRRRAGDAELPPQAGVLGNLPKKRPSVRSPRRAEASRAVSRERPRPGDEAGPKPPADAEREHAEEGSEHSHAADLEGLARGGIAIAAGAAALGLRIAGRTATAVRDVVERR